MKKLIAVLIILLFITIAVFLLIPKNKYESPVQNPYKEYTNSYYKLKLELPKEYTIEENYIHEITPTRRTTGVKFIIPESITQGTNLSKDTSISIESIPDAEYCTAELFTYYPAHKPDIITEDNRVYSLITSNEAGASNRYEEFIYTINDSNPCIAIRYFIHYSAFENYPDGSVKEFDKQSIIESFDRMRRSVVIGD